MSRPLPVARRSTLRHTAMPAPRLDCTLNHYLCPHDMSVAQFLDLAVTHGFSGVALTVRSLTECPARQLAPMLRARNLSVSSVNSAGYFFFDGSEAKEQAARNAWLLAQTAELGNTALNVIVGGSTALDLHEARERAIEQLHRFAERARACAVALLIEPFHPLLNRSKSPLNTIAECVELCAAIPGLLLNLDLFHSWWDPSIDWAVGAGSGHIGILQICDVHCTPESGLPVRVPLDEGMLPWRRYVKTLRDCQPDRPVELELFIDRMPGRDAHAITRESALLLAGLRND